MSLTFGFVLAKEQRDRVSIVIAHQVARARVDGLHRHRVLAETHQRSISSRFQVSRSGKDFLNLLGSQMVAIDDFSQRRRLVIIAHRLRRLDRPLQLLDLLIERGRNHRLGRLRVVDDRAPHGFRNEALGHGIGFGCCHFVKAGIDGCARLEIQRHARVVQSEVVAQFVLCPDLALHDVIAIERAGEYRLRGFGLLRAGLAPHDKRFGGRLHIGDAREKPRREFGWTQCGQ